MNANIILENKRKQMAFITEVYRLKTKQMVTVITGHDQPNEDSKLNTPITNCGSLRDTLSKSDNSINYNTYFQLSAIFQFAPINSTLQTGRVRRIKVTKVCNRKTDYILSLCYIHYFRKPK